MEYGLIGEKLGHSFSREIHQRLGGYDYRLQELTPAQLPAFLEGKYSKEKMAENAYWRAMRDCR